MTQTLAPAAQKFVNLLGAMNDQQLTDAYRMALGRFIANRTHETLSLICRGIEEEMDSRNLDADAVMTELGL